MQLNQIILIVIICCLFFVDVQGQNDGFKEFKIDEIYPSTPTPYKPSWNLTQSDSLFIEVSNGQKYLVHTIRGGQTLYSIKKFYAVDLSDLYYSNPHLETNGLKVGQKIRIPLVSKAMKRFKGATFDENAYKPIYYKVRPSETMYRISKIYFRLPLDILKSRNMLLTDELSKDQVLHIGWISKTGIPDSLKSYTGLSGVLGEESQKNKYRYETKFDGKNEKMVQGTACWDKAMSLSSKNKLYVMSSLVPKGGIVRIENPMTHRFLYAKVVAPKPVNSFTQSSVVMLTPTVAQALGGLDSKFYVKVFYCK